MTAKYQTSDDVDPEASSKFPPRWAQSLLTHMLKARDRESIPGDLLEEYREERLPLRGRTRANLWYLGQILSLAFFQALRGVYFAVCSSPNPSIGAVNSHASVCA